MGSSESIPEVEDAKGVSELKVGTLNYSGILLSPYEFYEGQEQGSELQQMSNIFQTYIDQDYSYLKQLFKEYPQFIENPDKGDDDMERENDKRLAAFQFKFFLGEFDKNWQKDRYTPLYNLECGINNNIFLDKKEDFYTKWNEAFQKKGKKKVKKYDQVQKANCRDFDYICFKTIVTYVYCYKNNKKIQRQELIGEYLEGGEKQLEAFDYKQHQRDFFQRAFVHQDNKVNLFVKVLLKDAKMDILFLQEATEYMVKGIQKRTNQYLIVHALSIKKKQKIQKNQSQMKEDSNMSEVVTLETIKDYYKKHLSHQKPQNDKKKQQSEKHEEAKKRDKNGEFSDPQPSQSAILIRRESFPKIGYLRQENNLFFEKINEIKSKEDQPQILTLKQLQSININKDTIIQVVGKLILLCPHLSSKKQKNKKQLAELRKCLQFLRNKFENHDIICGGDLNCSSPNELSVKEEQIMISFNNKSQQKNSFNYFPYENGCPTVLKKRTRMQPQAHKAEETFSKSEDYLITNLKMKNQSIQTISPDQFKMNSNIDKMPMLPTKKHPFDHLLVIATVILKRNTQNMEYGYQKEKEQARKNKNLKEKK